MFGDNPKRGILKGNGDILQVESIFYTLQGEGPYALVPSIFIRLGGCNLACEFCDTEFENFRDYRLDEIISKVNELSFYPSKLVNSDKFDDFGLDYQGSSLARKRLVSLVVITGGEPFRQPIEKLCEKLIGDKFTVQIETNGTLYRDLPDETEIICSPKIIGSNITGKYAPIREDLLKRLRAIKTLVSKSLIAYNAVPDFGQSKYGIEVYVQPMDQYDANLNKDNLELALEIVRKSGYRLSLQLHKMIGIE